MPRREEPDFRAQFRRDTETRIEQLENTRAMVDKQIGRAGMNKQEPTDTSQPANTWGGDYTWLNDDIRFCDVEEYVEHLREELRALVMRDTKEEANH